MIATPAFFQERSSNLTEQIESALRMSCAAPGLRCIGRHRWQLMLAGNPSLPVAVRIHHGWLIFESTLVDNRSGDFSVQPDALERCLLRGISLSGGAKYVLPADAGSIRVRAEIPLEAGSCHRENHVAARISAACLGLESAAAGTVSVVPANCGADRTLVSVDPIGLCREAGWSCSERAEERWLIDLETSQRDFYQANVERRPDGLRLWVDLTASGGDCLPQPSRFALAVLLLGAAEAVHMIRGFIERTPAGFLAGVDVMLPGEVTAAELAHGLSALSVACDLFGREAEALVQDEALAELYWCRRLSGRPTPH